MAEAKLTIPKGYDPNDAKAAEGIAKHYLPEEVVLLVEHSRAEVPTRPTLNYLGRSGCGVDTFSGIINLQDYGFENIID